MKALPLHLQSSGVLAIACQPRLPPRLLRLPPRAAAPAPWSASTDASSESSKTASQPSVVASATAQTAESTTPKTALPVELQDATSLEPEAAAAVAAAAAAASIAADKVPDVLVVDVDPQLSSRGSPQPPPAPPDHVVDSTTQGVEGGPWAGPPRTPANGASAAASQQQRWEAISVMGGAEGDPIVEVQTYIVVDGMPATAHSSSTSSTGSASPSPDAPGGAAAPDAAGGGGLNGSAAGAAPAGLGTMALVLVTRQKSKKPRSKSSKQMLKMLVKASTKLGEPGWCWVSFGVRVGVWQVGVPSGNQRESMSRGAAPAPQWTSCRRCPPCC